LPSPYARGRSAEYLVKGMLEDQGYLVIRSAASHTPIDLIAAKDGEVLAIQVKKGRIARKDKIQLIKWAKQFGAKPILATKRGVRWILTNVS